MADPLARVLAQIQRIGEAAPRIRARVADELRQAIDQRFAAGAAPVASGELRQSYSVSVEGDAVAARSPLPYAQRHPEALPPEAELRALVDGAARKELP